MSILLPPCPCFTQISNPLEYFDNMKAYVQRETSDGSSICSGRKIYTYIMCHIMAAEMYQIPCNEDLFILGHVTAIADSISDSAKCKESRMDNCRWIYDRVQGTASSSTTPLPVFDKLFSEIESAYPREKFASWYSELANAHWENINASTSIDKERAMVTKCQAIVKANTVWAACQKGVVSHEVDSALIEFAGSFQAADDLLDIAEDKEDGVQTHVMKCVEEVGPAPVLVRVVNTAAEIIDRSKIQFLKDNKILLLAGFIAKTCIRYRDDPEIEKIIAANRAIIPAEEIRSIPATDPIAQ